MSRRRRALVLGALAVTLGTLAGSDVSRREHALAQRIGPLETVVVARTNVPQGARLTTKALAVRRIPARFVAPGTFAAPGEVAGARTATAVPAGTFLTDAHLAREDVGGTAGAGGAGAGPPIRPGERVAEVVATGSAQLIAPGGRVDVLVTREVSGGGPGRTTLALEDVEVLQASAAPASDSGSAADKGARVVASLRVTPRQAVFLAAAQSFAREVRLLPRAAGDHRHGLAGTAVGAGLG